VRDAPFIWNLPSASIPSTGDNESVRQHTAVAMTSTAMSVSRTFSVASSAPVTVSSHNTIGLYHFSALTFPYFSCVLEKKNPLRYTDTLSCATGRAVGLL